MARIFVRLGTALLAVCAMVVAAAQPAVTTYHNDLGRTGLNSSETILTPQNVNTTSFGKLFSLPIDGPSNAQPLYVPNVSIPGKGVHNVVYVVTEHDTVYAFDADSNTGATAQPLWRATLLDAAHGAAVGATAEPIGDIGNCGDIPPEVGIVGTPVIDAAAGTLYLVGKTNENGVPVQRLHALDLTTGAEKANSPVTLQATVNGTGSGSSGGKLSFDPKWSIQRPGLLLLNGFVYIGFASHCDFSSWHGWMMAYDASTLQQASALVMTPNGTGSGIWMSGAAPAGEVVNGVARIFVSTGNGTYDANGNYGDDILRIESANGVMKIADHFTPFNQDTLNAVDDDVSSGGVMFLPDQSAGGHQRLLVLAAKEGRIYLVDRDNMGGYSTTANNIVQDLPNALAGMWGIPAYWNNTIYFWGCPDQVATTPEVLKAFSLTNGRLSTSPVSTAGRSSLYPGSILSLSANGLANGIVWGVIADQYRTAGNEVLLAFDASNVSRLLWSSDQNQSRDGAGAAVKFSVPTVVNGKVYVGSLFAVNVYGVLPTTTPAPVFTPAPGNYPGSVNVSIADAQAGAVIYYTVDGSTPTTASKVYSGTFNVAASTTLKAFATSAGIANSGVSTAGYAISPLSNLSVNLATFSGASMVFNGSATPGAQLMLTTGLPVQSGSAYYAVALPITGFNTSFNFVLQNPGADGMMFVMQNAGANALGVNGGGLGFAGMPASVGVKFDIFDNLGEGTSSTGLYLKGAAPTTPSQDLKPLGIDLRAGHPMNAAFSYDGKTLGMVLTDLTTTQKASLSWAVDIPATVGGNTAYVGFTAATGGMTVGAAVNSWTFTPTSVNQTPQSISFGALATQTVGTPLALAATASSTLPVSFAAAGPCVVTGNVVAFAATGTCTITASQPGNGTYAAAAPVSQSFTIAPAASLLFNFTSFNGASVSTSGSAAVGAQLTLVNGAALQAGSAYYANPVGVQNFNTNFTFVMQNPEADGMVFVIQNAGPNALGVDGGGLGFSGLAASIGVKFDIYDNSGEGVSSTGLYLNGASPTTPALDLKAQGIDLRSGHPFNAALQYDGVTLKMVLTDMTTQQKAAFSWTVDIPTTVGDTTAYVGFSAATGGLTVTAAISNWSYSTVPVAALQQTISFNSVPGQTVGRTVALAATASSGLAVSFASSTPGVCSVSGNTAAMVAAGTCTVTASQAGNGTYAAAAPVSQSFAVSAAAPQGQTITFNAIGNQVVGSQLALTASASSGLAVSFASSTPGVCSVSGNTAAMVTAGTCTVTASQPGNGSYAAAAPVVRSFTVTSPAPLAVDLSGSYNHYGIMNDQMVNVPGFLDNAVANYSTTQLGTSLVWSGVTFRFGPVAAPDCVANRAVALPAGSFSTLRFLATGVNGNQPSQLFTVLYTDNTTTTYRVSLSDWMTPQSYPGEATVKTMAYRVVPLFSSGGLNGRDNRTTRLYGYSLLLNPAKTVARVTLPANDNVVVMGIALVP